MAGPAFALKFHPAAAYVPSAIQSIPITLGSDVDLTNPAGQTGGLCARFMLNTGMAGNLTFYDVTGAGPYTIAFAANQEIQMAVSYIVNSTTTITPVAQL